MRIAASLWCGLAVVAALMGVLLVVSDEPGATAGRWYLGLMVLGVALGAWGFRADPSTVTTSYVIASGAGVALVAVQTFVISAFAYQGLSAILLVLAALATLAATAVWWRER